LPCNGILFSQRYPVLAAVGSTALLGALDHRHGTGGGGLVGGVVLPELRRTVLLVGIARCWSRHCHRAWPARDARTSAPPPAWLPVQLTTATARSTPN
jgi:hypothetical protein